MNKNSVLYLGILYIILGVIMTIYIYQKYSKKKNERFYYVVNYMYILIFSIVPAMTHLYVYNNGNNERKYAAIDYSSIGISKLYLFLLFSIIGFLGLQLGYNLRTVKNKHTMNEEINNKSNLTSDQVWIVSAFIMLVIGLFTQLLWTRAYGGIIGILSYSSDLRSGKDIGILNPYTVFKRFVPLVQFANVIYFAIWIKTKKISAFLFSMVSLIASIMYLLANDGRAPLIFHLVALISIVFLVKKEKSLLKNTKIKKKKMSIVGIFLGAMFTLFAIHNADVFINLVVAGNKNFKLSWDIFSSIREEFAFTVRDGQAAMLYLEEHPFSFRFLKELISGILGVLPSSFRPESIEKLEIINTTYWVKGAPYIYYGGKPPEVLSTGIYMFNYFGVFILPFILGKIIKKFDGILLDLKGMSKEIFFSVCLYPLIRVVAYANFDGIALSFFYIFLGYLILYFVKKYTKNGDFNEERL